MDRRRLTDCRHAGIVACLLLLATGTVLVAVAQEPLPPAPSSQQDGTPQPTPASVLPPAPPPQPTPAAAATPAPQPASPLPPVVTGTDATALRLYMPDGQLMSHRLSVYVTGSLQESHKPVLRLFRSHAITAREEDEEKPLVPTFIAAGQQWTETVDGQDIRQTGTILLFDGSQVPLGFKAMVRVRPALTWIEGASERRLLGPHEVNVGNIVFAVLWTVGVVAVTVLIVVLLAWRRDSNPILLLTGVDGHLSLAQTQVACWTVFVGSVVLGYGLIRLEIPEIPESLVVLMGASLVTGGVAYFQDAKKERTAVSTGVAVGRRWAWGDLVRVFAPDQEPELSLSKAQMLFWTVLLLVLFVSKSILEGRIWEVPWPLVALMGFSQAGYLAPKLAPPAVSPPSPPGPEPPPSALLQPGAPGA